MTPVVVRRSFSLMKPRLVKVSDRMQKGYSYLCTEPAGKNFAAGFEPQLTPAQMLPGPRLAAGGAEWLPTGSLNGGFVTLSRGCVAEARCVHSHPP